MWYREAQQGRLNLDSQTGVENFRNELKSLITRSLVKNKLNPLEFVIDFKKLNELLQESSLKYYVDDISPMTMPLRIKTKAVGMFRARDKKMWLPVKYNSENYATVLHEVVHSIDPQNSTDYYSRLRKTNDFNKPYFRQNAERLAFFEQLDDFYSTEKLNKVLEIYYIKDKKKYPTVEIATKAFLEDLKNHMQNPVQSMLLNPSRMQSYLTAVNNGKGGYAAKLILESFDPINEEELRSKLKGVLKTPAQKDSITREYLAENLKRTNSKDTHYFDQLQKFFSNKYLETVKTLMPDYNSSVKPYNQSTSAYSVAAKSLIARYISLVDGVSLTKAQSTVDFLVFKKRDFFNKLVDTLRTLRVSLDENFNFQDPRWQILEPIVEVFLNEFITYMENPEAYKSSVSVNQKAVNKSINPYKAWQELVLSYKQKYKTPEAILTAIRKDNPTISIQIPNFASGQIFDKPFSIGNQSSKPFNQLDPKVQENIIYMINNNGSLPPGNDDIPNMSLNEVNKLKMQQ
jgi:hypothetical protein